MKKAFVTQAHSKHPLSRFMMPEQLADSQRRLEWQQIEEEVRAYSRQLMLKAPLTTEERIFSGKTLTCDA